MILWQNGKITKSMTKEIIKEKKNKATDLILILKNAF